MRSLIIPFAAWFAALQLPMPSPPATIKEAAALITAAGGLASMTVLVYRLGGWRQEMQNTKVNVAGEIARYREEMVRSFDQLERRFTNIDRFIQAAAEQRVAGERWQARVDTTLEAVDTRLDQLEADRRDS